MRNNWLIDLMSLSSDIDNDLVFTAITTIKNNGNIVNLDNVVNELKLLGVEDIKITPDDEYVNDYIDNKFLDRYVVFNYFSNEYVKETYGIKDIDKFKKYLNDLAADGYFNFELEKHIADFKS